MLYELAIATDKNLSHLARIRRRPRCDFDDRHDNKSPSGVAGMRIREFANTCGYMSLVLAETDYHRGFIGVVISFVRISIHGCIRDVFTLCAKYQPRKAAPKLDIFASILDLILISLAIQS
jgi:hypothetical protein